MNKKNAISVAIRRRLTQDKRLNIWSTASGKHVRAYKVEPSTPLSAEPLASSSAEGGGGGGGGEGGAATTAEGAVGSAGGGLAGGGSGGGSGAAKSEAGGELFKVDLDPTGMYAAACSFDKVSTAFERKASAVGDHFLSSPGYSKLSLEVGTLTRGRGGLDSLGIRRWAQFLFS